MSSLKKFNPYDLPEKTLHAIATGREEVLERLLGIIARNAEGGRVQHLQIIAPRGYGKSFLMRMLQSALKERVKAGLPAILALLPEEQHNVDAPSRLLNEIQRLLEGRPADNLLGGAFTESDEAWEQAVAALDAAIAARLPEGRGIAVAIVENFDRLISEIFRDARDQSRLRALLDRPGKRLMLLATATRQADADYEQRLFHATRPIELEPWKEELCLAFFEKLRAHREKGEMSPQLQGKAKAIARFIGGSPRMATVLAEVLDSNDSLRVAEVLEQLIDELTPYYKHRIESLSRRARTLLDALLRMGEPRTQSEIAARLGTVQARIAEPFNELRARKEVVGEKAQQSAEMLYRVGDRLMAHYYRRRHLNPGESTSLLEGIIEFLEAYYTPEERELEAKRLRELGRPADAAVFERLAKATNTLSVGGSDAGPGNGWLDELREKLVDLQAKGQLGEALNTCQQAVKRAEESGERREVARSRRFLGWMLGQLGRHAEAEATLQLALELAEQVGDLGEQASSLRHLGWTLGQEGRHAEAEATLRRALQLAAQAGNLREQAESSRHLGWTLGQLGRHAEAEAALRRSMELAEQAGDLREQLESSKILGWGFQQRNLHVQAHAELLHALDLAERWGDAKIIDEAKSRLLLAAIGSEADATIVSAWQRVSAGMLTESGLLDYTLWFDDAAAAALRSGQFDTFWTTVAALPLKDGILGLGQTALANVVEHASKAQGRAAAYALAAHGIEVLAQDASMRTTRESFAGPDPMFFLRGLLFKLAQKVSDPALLRDIVALLEQRLPSETAAERALLEGRAVLEENPGNPAALERFDPDTVTVLKEAFSEAFKPASKALPPSDTRKGKARRKK